MKRIAKGFWDTDLRQELGAFWFVGVFMASWIIMDLVDSQILEPSAIGERAEDSYWWLVLQIAIGAVAMGLLVMIGLFLSLKAIQLRRRK